MLNNSLRRLPDLTRFIGYRLTTTTANRHYAFVSSFYSGQQQLCKQKQKHPAFLTLKLTSMEATQIGSFIWRPSSSDAITVRVYNDPEAERFFIKLGEHIAFLKYERGENARELVLLHTEVPQELQGKGLGKILGAAALEYLAKNNLRAKVECEFLQDYIAKYKPEYLKYIVG